jgi:tellurite resistance protein TehA-like permease
MVVGKPRSRKPTVMLARSVAALATSTLLAALNAVQLGATAAPGIFAVSFVLGLFFTTSYGLALWAAQNGPKSSNSAVCMTRD